MENNRLVAVRYLWFQRWMSWSVGFGRSHGLWRIVIVCREFCTSLPCIFSLPWLLLSIICFESTILLHLLVYHVFISHRQQRLQLYSVHQSTSLHDKWYDLTLVRSSQNLTEIHFSSCGKYQRAWISCKAKLVWLTITLLEHPVVGRLFAGKIFVRSGRPEIVLKISRRRLSWLQLGKTDQVPDWFPMLIGERHYWTLKMIALIRTRLFWCQEPFWLLVFVHNT